MQYLDYDREKIKWEGVSPVKKTFLVAPLTPRGSVMIFNHAGELLRTKQTAGFPANFLQLPDLSGYSYFAGRTRIGPKQDGIETAIRANGRYTTGSVYITDNDLETIKVIDYIPTSKIPRAIGLHFHGNYVLGKDHYLVQALSREDVLINGKRSYVVNCILQEQLDGNVVWEWQSIDAPRLFEASFAKNEYFCKDVLRKEYACDYAHMNSAVKTSDGKYIYISFKHIGIIKLDYTTKEILWILGRNSQTLEGVELIPEIFAHQHDIHLLDDNTLYFWDNDHSSYTELQVIDNKITHFKTFSCPKTAQLAVMGNVVRASDTVIDVCYGLSLAAKFQPHRFPIVSEYDLVSGEKLVDLTITTFTPELSNVLYQINRGVNVYEPE